jgi:hypothetical protein
VAEPPRPLTVASVAPPLAAAAPPKAPNPPPTLTKARSTATPTFEVGTPAAEPARDSIWSTQRVAAVNVAGLGLVGLSAAGYTWWRANAQHDKA